MGTDQWVIMKPTNKHLSEKMIAISLAEYAFYQDLEKQFKDVRTMEMEVEEAMENGTAYTNAKDFMKDLLKDD